MDSEWLRDAVRFTLRASTTPVASVDDEVGPPQQRDPRLRKLVEGILYSRRLILSYHLVIFLVILIISARHWGNEGLRWRKRRFLKLQSLASSGTYDGFIIQPPYTNISNIDNTIGESASSGSSTIEGTASPPRKDVDEDTPLLQDGHIQILPYPRRSVILSIKSFLTYQPRPIPFFNKTLPSNGTSLVVISFIFLNIFYNIYHINFSIFELFVLADRFGLLFVANLPLLYVLAAKTQPLKVLTGTSYESLNIFHRRLGEILCLEALLHCLGMACVWYTLLRPTGFTLSRFLLNKVIILGIGAFISYELLYFTSLASFRQRWYELFLGTHVILQVAALLFLFFHHPGSRIYVGIALGIFLVDRVIYRVGVKSVSVVASAEVMEDEETVKLSVEVLHRPGGRLSRLIGRSIKDGWKATDHVFVTIPSLGRKHMLQAHPFTISSRAPFSGENEMQLDLLIRAQDGFSRDLLNKSRRLEREPRSILTVRLDGPYGSSHARNLLAASDLAIVVAGGSGIAVAWPLVHHLLRISRSSDTEIVPTFALKRQKIVLIWVVHKGAHLEWIGKKAMTELANMGVEMIVPDATELAGRPDLGIMIRDAVDTWSTESGNERKKIGVASSGPDSMGRLVRNTCSNLQGKGRDIDVTIEKFGW